MGIPTAGKCSAGQLEEQRDNREDDEDDDDPLGDAHTETSHTARTEHGGDFRQYEEGDRDTDEVAPELEGSERGGVEYGLCSCHAYRPCHWG